MRRLLVVGLTAAAVLWAVPALAGAWATIRVLDADDLTAGAWGPAGREIRVQVLQHGEYPRDDARVTIVARSGGERREFPAELQRVTLERGHPEPVYVARVSLPAGRWEIEVRAEHDELLVERPVAMQVTVGRGGRAAAWWVVPVLAVGAGGWSLRRWWRKGA